MMVRLENKCCPDHGITEFRLTKIQLNKYSANNGWWCCRKCWDETVWVEDCFYHQVWSLMKKFEFVR